MTVMIFLALFWRRWLIWLAVPRPHNMKLYNLCRIKKIGVERWIEEEAGQIRKKYFTGKFIVGKGQAD